ncbi:hypothetical protein [Paraburkholderia saeva]|uniref:Uncharacterized protein n=1 Tax=Paraburkholderia saeva TaxID=2777537 RepID=A0A9N8RX36_9BURK|nr:hypothetical protein [Paraburkholderia saeva]CAG4900818.1 hypothetical protein LMG31841_02921 [Paraburkholderia saeva]
MTAYLGVATDEPIVQSISFKAAPADKITSIYHLALTISPVSVAANTTAEQTFALAGLAVGDVVYVSKPTSQAGLGIVNARVSAANTLAITFSNNTASPIVPTAAEVYQVGGLR